MEWMSRPPSAAASRPRRRRPAALLVVVVVVGGGLLLALGLLLVLVTGAGSSQQDPQRALKASPAPPHKPFYPLDQEDVITIGLASLGLIVAAGGGIGGGGILVPLYVLVLGFAPKRAIPLSNVTILGGSIANVMAGLRGRHPHADRPLIDWNLVLMMEPTTIVGAVLGSFLNKVLPELVVSILLVVVLGALAHRTLKKGLQQLAREGGLASLCSVGDRWTRRHARIRRKQKESALVEHRTPPSPGSSSSSEEEGTALLGDEGLARPQMNSYSSLPRVPSQGMGIGGGAAEGPNGSVPRPRRYSYAGPETIDDEENEDEEDQAGVPPEILSTRSPSFVRLPPGRRARLLLLGRGQAEEQEEGNGGRETNPALAAILERERSIPLWQPAALTLCFAGILVLNLLKGGEGAPSPLGLTCGSWGYWLVTIAAIPWVGLFFVCIRRWMLAEHEAKIRAGYEFHSGDIQWTPRSTLLYPLLCVSAGIMAGIFGVGGGIVKGPLMLELGVAPPVAAASAACMILFTSASASAAYWTFGLIPIDYGLALFIVGFICTAIGQAVVTLLMRKYKRQSFIILSIGSVILLSAFMMGFEALTDFLEDPEGAKEFGSLCHGK